MCGSYCRLGAVGVVNGPIASQCFAELWVVECVGCGTRRTTSGPKYILNTNGDGYMSMLARVSGTSRDFTPKVCFSQGTNQWVRSDHVYRLESQTLILHCILHWRRNRCDTAICSKLFETRSATNPSSRRRTIVGDIWNTQIATGKTFRARPPTVEERRRKGRARAPHVYDLGSCSRDHLSIPRLATIGSGRRAEDTIDSRRSCSTMDQWETAEWKWKSRPGFSAGLWSPVTKQQYLSNNCHDDTSSTIPSQNNLDVTSLCIRGAKQSLSMRCLSIAAHLSEQRPPLACCRLTRLDQSSLYIPFLLHSLLVYTSKLRLVFLFISFVLTRQFR